MGPLPPRSAPRAELLPEPAAVPLEVGCGNRPPSSSSRRAEPGGGVPAQPRARPTVDCTVGVGIHKALAVIPWAVEGGCEAGRCPKPHPKARLLRKASSMPIKDLRPAEFAGHIGAQQLPAGPCHEAGI